MSVIVAKIENGRMINLGGKGWHTFYTSSKTFDEKIVEWFEARPWCHNVISITNFHQDGCCITCDVEYNPEINR